MFNWQTDTEENNQSTLPPPHQAPVLKETLNRRRNELKELVALSVKTLTRLRIGYEGESCSVIHAIGMEEVKASIDADMSDSPVASTTIL